MSKNFDGTVWFVCKFCKRAYQRRKYLRRHKKEFHVQDRVEVSDTSSTELIVLEQETESVEFTSSPSEITSETGVISDENPAYVSQQEKSGEETRRSRRIACKRINDVDEKEECVIPSKERKESFENEKNSHCNELESDGWSIYDSKDVPSASEDERDEVNTNFLKNILNGNSYPYKLRHMTKLSSLEPV